MKKQQTVKRQQAESISESIDRFLAGFLKVLVSIIIILVLAVMPFYFQEGFTHIGSDKSYFYRVGTVRMSRLILPVLVLWLICFAVNTFLKRRKGMRRKGMRHKGMLREWAQTLSATDWFAFSYGLSAFFSYVCSHYKGAGFWNRNGTAFWGTRGWYMGLIPQLTLVAIYFLVSRFQFKIIAKWLLWLSLPVSAVVFVLGYLNRFDIWPIPMANSGLPEFISTIGNINWYCGYAVAVGFVGVGLLWLGGTDKTAKSEKPEGKCTTILLSVYVFLFFSTMITQGSDSGLFALAIIFLVMFYCSAKDGEDLRMRRFWLLVMLLMAAGLATMGLRFLFPGRMNYTSQLGDLLTLSPLPLFGMALACAGLWLGRQPHWKVLRAISKTLCVGVLITAAIFIAMITVNTLRPGSLGSLSEKPVFTFNDKWGSSRGASWSLGVRCFWEQDLLHKLSGVGPDCMADFLYSTDKNAGGASEALTARAREAFENRRLTNAHCELLTILVNMGILGMVSFAGMLFTAVGRFLRARGRSCFAAACGLCVLAYMANNVWSFQQSMSLATIAIILGMGEWFT